MGVPGGLGKRLGDIDWAPGDRWTPSPPSGVLLQHSRDVVASNSTSNGSGTSTSTSAAHKMAVTKLEELERVQALVGSSDSGSARLDACGASTTPAALAPTEWHHVPLNKSKGLGLDLSTSQLGIVKDCMESLANSHD